MAVAVCLVWFLAWAHPLYPPDEGRYGSASATMAETGQWLVPEFRGKAHLTKPPLTYWLQAAGVAAFGRTEMAVRWPGLVATSLGLACLFWFARRTLGTRPAVITVAMASVMPYTLIVGRLANTDAILAAAWLIALASGFLAIERKAPLLPALATMWGATAIAFLTKGPAGLGPVLILGAWCMLGRRTRDLARLHPWFGLPLALVPLGVWVTLVVAKMPDVGSLWWDETIGRVTGEKNLRDEPFWFYVPLFLGGMYPATTMLVLPWFNLGWRDVWTMLRAGDLRAMLLIAVLFPFLGFSISSGKLPTYLLPLAAPTAMLVAITLERWLNGTYDRAIPGFKPPDVRRTLAVVAIILFLGQLAASIFVVNAVPELWSLVLPLGVAPLGCVILWRVWALGPAVRQRGLVIAWVGMVASWTVIFAIETRYASAMGARAMLAYVQEQLGLERPTIITVSFRDPTIAFYNGGEPTREVRTLDDIRGLAELVTPAIVLVREDELTEIAAASPAVASQLEPFGTWTKWFALRVKVFLLNDQPDRIDARSPATAAPSSK